VIHGKIGETVAGVRLDNNTASMNKANGEYLRRQKLQKMGRRIRRIFGKNARKWGV